MKIEKMDGHLVRRGRVPRVVGIAALVTIGVVTVALYRGGVTGSGTLVPAAQASPGSGDAVARGKYLVSIAGCNDCHTPLKMGPKGPGPDLGRLLSGHPADLPVPTAEGPRPPWLFMGNMTMTAFVGPWGTSFAANLTPDDETGIGAWDEQLFIRALRGGKHLGAGRPIMPPMPWQGIANMTDDDLKAVSAYLHSIPPIKNRVPDYVPPAGPPPGMKK